MKILKMDFLLKEIEMLSESEYLDPNAPEIQKYIRLLDLLAEAYISPEHLLVAKEDWYELFDFILSLQDSSSDNIFGKTIRKKLKNTTIVKKLKSEFTQIKTPLICEEYV